MNSLPHIITINEEAVAKAKAERERKEVDRLLSRASHWMSWVRDAISDPEEDEQGMQVYEFIRIWRDLVADSAFEIGDYADMFRTTSDIAVNAPEGFDATH